VVASSRHHEAVVSEVIGRDPVEPRLFLQEKSEKMLLVVDD
jgi:hypothetical protein